MAVTRPGSSPEQAVYWFNGALIMLTAKVYEATAFNEGILRIVRYREEKSPLASINAVLLSIEHVVLVKAFADGVVEHTGVMPLFEISNHLSMDVRERYAEGYTNKTESSWSGRDGD